MRQPRAERVLERVDLPASYIVRFLGDPPGAQQHRLLARPGMQAVAILGTGPGGLAVEGAFIAPISCRRPMAPVPPAATLDPRRPAPTMARRKEGLTA
jgi:hypothetical protein